MTKDFYVATKNKAMEETFSRDKGFFMSGRKTRQKAENYVVTLQTYVTT